MSNEIGTGSRYLAAQSGLLGESRSPPFAADELAALSSLAVTPDHRFANRIPAHVRSARRTSAAIGPAVLILSSDPQMQLQTEAAAAAESTR
ncbi:hypothetical protein AB0J47_40985 [Nocardia sp. NPDC049737]|uniref:hypothetical protein n=1 Tax=Nocardia sp. NPDC049737 TaxID=3154358 RepID=UPI00343CD00E